MKLTDKSCRALFRPFDHLSICAVELWDTLDKKGRCEITFLRRVPGFNKTTAAKTRLSVQTKGHHKLSPTIQKRNSPDTVDQASICRRHVCKCECACMNLKEQKQKNRNPLWAGICLHSANPLTLYYQTLRSKELPRESRKGKRLVDLY